MRKTEERKFRSIFSIWIIIGIIVVMTIVSGVLTFTHFQRQKEQAIELLVEKGATLIRSFEAGLRGSSDIRDNTYYLEKLLIETAQQPDIDYIIVTDTKGKIIADSDPSMVGEKYGLDLDLQKIVLSPDIVWRQTTNPEGAGTFEVYRGFLPQEQLNKSSAGKAQKQKNNLIIYVGLNMAAIEKANTEDRRNTFLIAFILLLVGSSVVISLLLIQAWRLTHSSLSRVTAFSDALVNNMPMGIIAVDENGRISACNEMAGTILNISCYSAIGRETAVLLPGSLQKIMADLSAQDGVVEKDMQLTLAQNENKTLEVVATTLKADGAAAGRILLFRDVTAVRRLEREVARSRHLNSLASLAAGVAHEIRNPLSSIKGFAVYFKERLSGHSEDQKTAEIMIAEVERLNRVISQLIEFARPLQLKLEKADLSDLIRHSLELIAADAKKRNITVTTEIEPALPFLEADPDKVKQVLLNIFLNSMAAMKDSGMLSIRLLPENNNILVIISDNGVGIDEMDLPHIYDPYFTSKPTGTGLGLAVVQKIMEAHGGAINVESVRGVGTTVSLLFPLTNSDQRNVK